MLPDAALPVPASLMTLLAVFSPLFTASSFRAFSVLACGFLAQSGKRTVCVMLTGAGLSRIWPHDRAHYFFSRARWNPGKQGRDEAVAFGITGNRAWTGTREPPWVRARGLTAVEAIIRALAGGPWLPRIVVTGPLAVQDP